MATVHGVLRPVVPGIETTWLRPDPGPMAVVVGELGRPDADRLQLIGQAQLGQLAHCVRQDVDPDTEGLDPSS